jgi:hypothetical protein
MEPKDKIKIAVDVIQVMGTVTYMCMDYKRNEDISRELKTEPVSDNIFKYEI